MSDHTRLPDVKADDLPAALAGVPGAAGAAFSPRLAEVPFYRAACSCGWEGEGARLPTLNDIHFERHVRIREEAGR